MKFISNNNITDPTLNLAMEEYVLKNLPAEESYFLFYINRSSIIVGRIKIQLRKLIKNILIRTALMLCVVYLEVVRYITIQVI